MELSAGAFGALKSPAAPRTVDYMDPTEVALLADLLMRLLDRTEQRLSQQPTTRESGFNYKRGLRSHGSSR